MNIPLIKLIQAVGVISLLCASAGAVAQQPAGALPPPKPQVAQAARPTPAPAVAAPHGGPPGSGGGRSAKPKAYTHNNPDPFATVPSDGSALPGNVRGLPSIAEMQRSHPGMLGAPGVPGGPGMPGMPGMPGTPGASGDLDAEALAAAKTTGEYLGVAGGDRVWRMDGILYFEKTEKKIKD